MRIIRWSVDHPLLVIGFYAAVLALAVAALRGGSVPLRMMPAVESPLLAVVTRAPGLPPEEVERDVTDLVEARMAQVSGVRFVRSTSMRGLSIVTLEFPYRWDMRRAAQDAAARLPVPGRGEAPSLQPFDPLDLPVMRLAVRASSLDGPALRHLAETLVAARLRPLPGVASVNVFGGRPHPDLEIDRARLAALGLTLSDVSAALKRGGLDTPLASGVRVRDLVRAGGHAEMSSTSSHDEGTLYRLNGQDAVEVSVFQGPRASSRDTVATVRAELTRLRDEHPQLTIEEASDDAHFVGLMARNLYLDLGLGVALTGLVLFLFLGTVRGTLIALVTIPTSMACAVIFLVPLSLSLDSSSLVGLLLALGRLVDDAVIDLHAVSRHLSLGKSRRSAAVDGCSEVRPAVVSATVVVGLAMLPLTFCGGLTQDMFVGIVWPYLLSLAASLLVALTLTPVLASRFLRAGPAEGWRWPARHYRRVLAWAMGHRALVLFGAACLSYVAVMLFPLIGSEMMPMSDTGQAYAVLQGREPARMARALEQILLRRKEVLKVSTEVGIEPTGGAVTGYGMGDASMVITLTDRDRRTASIWDVIDGVWREAVATMPDLRRLTIREMGADLMASAMAPVEVVLYGPRAADGPAPNEASDRVRWLAERTLALAPPDLVQGGVAWPADEPRWRIRVNRARAMALGLSVDEVERQALQALDGLRGEGVTLRLSGPVMVVGTNGRVTPLAAVADFEKTTGPSAIVHDNQRLSDSVSGSYRVGGRGSMEIGMDLMMRSMMNLPYPPGYGIEQRGDMTQMMDAFRRLLWGLGVALILIYLALAVQFRGPWVPLALMAAIPLELSGVFAALVLFHQTFSTVSLLGIVVLSGMDVTASILLVDRIEAERRAGRDCAAAVLEAGEVRLAPILMTVLVTIATLAPVALLPRAGIDAYAPLATVVIGGLAVSTPLSLLVVPLLYAWLRPDAVAED